MLCQVIKPDIEKTNIVWFHSYEVLRVIEFIETESWMVAARDYGEEEMGN